MKLVTHVLTLPKDGAQADKILARVRELGLAPNGIKSQMITTEHFGSIFEFHKALQQLRDEFPELVAIENGGTIATCIIQGPMAKPIPECMKTKTDTELIRRAKAFIEWLEHMFPDESLFVGPEDEQSIALIDLRAAIARAEKAKVR